MRHDDKRDQHANVGFLLANQVLPEALLYCQNGDEPSATIHTVGTSSSAPIALRLGRRGPLSLERFLDLTGREYERCTVIGLAGSIRGYTVWLCQCNCGTQFLIRTNILQSKAVGCGCKGGKWDRHGDYGSVEWRAWDHIMQKRGEVCIRWHRYRNFLADLGRRPGPKHVLFRLDKALPYEPGNVSWLPKAEASARQGSTYISYAGKTLNIAGWARRLGISHQAMNQRIQRCIEYGAPLSEALTTPPGEFMPTAFEHLKRASRANRTNGKAR